MSADPSRTVAFTTCALHKAHWPQPLVAQRHHSYPKYLQAQALRITETALERDPRFDQTTIEVCGTGHDTIHELIRRLLRGDVPAKRDRAGVWARYAVDHYRAAGGA